MAIATTQAVWRSGGGDQTRTAYCGSGLMAAQFYIDGSTAAGTSVKVSSASGAPAVVLPAGAIIFEIYLYQSGATFTSGTSGTFTIYINGTAAGALTITTGTAGILSITPSSQAQAALWANVGTTDAVITYTMGSSGTFSAGAGVLLIEYIVRNSDGTYLPTSYTA